MGNDSLYGEEGRALEIEERVCSKGGKYIKGKNKKF